MAKVVNKNTSSKAKEIRVKPNDLVKIKWKGGRFHKDGTFSKVHRVQAEKLVSLGRAEIVTGNESETEVED